MIALPPKADDNAVTLDDILERYSLDPMKNLELSAKYLARQTRARVCQIVADIGVIASNGGSGRLPAENILRIPVVIKDLESAYMGEKRARSDRFRNVKGYIYLSGGDISADAEQECNEVMNIIGNNIEMYQTLVSARTDKLTGAFNRRYLDISIVNAFDKARKNGEPLSVIICDLDFFKHINDTYGHLAGDEVLRATSGIISKNIGENGVLGRYGGEEFVVYLENTDNVNAVIIAERIRTAIFESKILGGKRDITLSLGVATFPEQADTVKSLIKKADKALYIAKKRGRNRCETYDESFNDEVITKNSTQEFITGDAMKDTSRMLLLFEILEISRQKMDKYEKINMTLKKILDATDASNATLILLDAENSEEKIEVSQKGQLPKYNPKIIAEVLDGGNGVFMVDWDNDAPDSTGLTDWRSVAAAPVIRSGVTKGVLYLSVSVKVKEFKSDEAGFISSTAMLFSAIL